MDGPNPLKVANQLELLVAALTPPSLSNPTGISDFHFHGFKRPQDTKYWGHSYL